MSMHMIMRYSGDMTPVPRFTSWDVLHCFFSWSRDVSVMPLLK